MPNNIYNFVGPKGFKVSQSQCEKGEDCFYDDETGGWYFRHNNNEFEYFQDDKLVQSRNNMVEFFRNDRAWGNAPRDCVLGNHDCPHLKRGRLFIKENKTTIPLKRITPDGLVPIALYVPKNVPWSTVERILDGYPGTFTDIALECKYHSKRCGGSAEILTFGIYSITNGRHEYHHVSKTNRDAIDGIRSCIAHVGSLSLNVATEDFKDEDFHIGINIEGDTGDDVETLYIIRHDIFPLLGEHNLTHMQLLQHHDLYGNAGFGEIPDVNLWDDSTYYVWGANASNYNSIEGTILNGDTIMAGTDGPTHGLHHPMYIGIITTSYKSDGQNIEELVMKNQAVFKFLRDERRKGKNIIFPIKHALGFSLSTKVVDNEENLITLRGYFLNAYLSLGMSVDLVIDTMWSMADILDKLNVKK